MTDPRSAGANLRSAGMIDSFSAQLFLRPRWSGWCSTTRAVATSPPTSMVWSLRRKPQPAQVGTN